MFTLFKVIHPYDVLRFIEKLGESGIVKNIMRLFRSEDDRVRTTWNHSSSISRSWLDIPAIHQRINKKISDNEVVEHYDYVAKKYFSDGKKRIALSIGCGAGGRELLWATTGAFSRIDAYDLSPSRIISAQQKAKEQHLDSILHLSVGDIRTHNFSQQQYDVIIAEGILHHLSPLEEVLQKLKSFLKSDGVFIVNEYVGPTRFQWTKKQLHEINQLLSLFPEQYTIRENRVSKKRNVHRPGLLTMYLYDPSEAIESAHISLLLKKYFLIHEWKEYGGTILHMLFKDIAHHFIEPDDTAKHLLDKCFSTEDNLLEAKIIQSDFVFIICSPM